MALSYIHGKVVLATLLQTAILPLQPAAPLAIQQGGSQHADLVTDRPFKKHRLEKVRANQIVNEKPRHRRKRRHVSLLGQFQQWQSWSELIHLRNRNFVFCALPKSACTLWKQLLLRASGSKHWDTINSTLIHHPSLSGLDLVGVNRGMHTHNADARNESDIVELLNADTLQTAVMVRDPVTRLLSSYLDRCVDNNEWHRCFSRTRISFEQTVLNLEDRWKSGAEIKDVHLRNQTDMCGLRYMNYSLIGHMENFYNDSRMILRAVGLWDDFGEHGWGPDGHSSFGMRAQNSSNHKKKHNTKYLVCHHYSPDLLQRTYRMYKTDFDTFGYSIDTWLAKCAEPWRRQNEHQQHVKTSLEIPQPPQPKAKARAKRAVSHRIRAKAKPNRRQTFKSKGKIPRLNRLAQPQSMLEKSRRVEELEEPADASEELLNWPMHSGTNNDGGNEEDKTIDEETVVSSNANDQD